MDHDNPRLTDKEKNHFCLRSDRERILELDRNLFKPCHVNWGVKFSDKTAFDNLVKDIEEGKKRQECEVCWDAESQNKMSYRQIGNDLWKNPLNGNSHTEFITNRICSNACIYCSVNDSSAWLNEITTANIDIPTAFKKFRPQHLVTDDDNQRIDNYLKELAEDESRWVCMGSYGGESFQDPKIFEDIEHRLEIFFKYNKKEYRVVRYDICTGLNYSNDNCLYYIASLNKIKKKFPSVQFVIQASMESTGLVYEYVRYGNTWKNANDNLDTFLKKTDYHIEIMATINNVSWYNFPKFLKYINKTAKRTRPLKLQLNYLKEPEMYSIALLDNSFNRYIGKAFNYIENNKLYITNPDDFVASLNRSLKIINTYTAKQKERHMLELLDAFDYFLKIRNTDIKDINKELYDYIIQNTTANAM